MNHAMTESTPLTAEAEASLQLCLQLNLACATLTRRLDNALSSVHGLSFADFSILYHLAKAPGERLRRTDLAERLGLTASGVTRSLLPLEKIGLVERQPDPRDARVGHAAITATGRELLGHALRSVGGLSQDLLQGVDATQREALAALLGPLLRGTR